ncbi:glycosyltransferase family 4 protein [Escherichia coli]|uniref:glycosyltransferase family 4 protein n=1 Tax=Escherichia coli TaxID=562 RepID=UPI000DD082F3|nr:glycosyltransferase [Escherichia coli]
MEHTYVSIMVRKPEMKVVHIIIDLNVGGAELMLQRLIKHTADNNVEHVVISLTDIGTLGEEILKSGVDVKCLNINSPIKYATSLLKLYKLFTKIKPDVVHTWMYHSDLIGGISAKLAGVKKIIWCVRSTDISKGGNKLTLLIRWLCAKISSFIPDTIVYAANASKEVHEQRGYDKNKSLVIANGFDLTKLSPDKFSRSDLRKEIGLAENDVVVCSVGRYSPVKDHSTFISAALQLAEEFSNVRFLLVGRGLTTQNKIIMTQLSVSCHSDKFILLGERSDVPACLNASDIFCLHSVTEGFPNVLGEAMAMGIPSVTSNVGDAAFLLDKVDFVVPAGNSYLLAQKLREVILLSRKNRTKLGRILRLRIENEFSMDTVANKYLSLYKN